MLGHVVEDHLPRDRRDPLQADDEVEVGEAVLLSEAVAAPDQNAWASKLRDSLAAYRRSEDLINLGAYTAGGNARLDAAVKEQDRIGDFLRQQLNRSSPLKETLAQLKDLAARV